MTRMVSQILWEHCMGELGIDGNNYENDTFAVRSYDWVDEDNNEWHFWHKPSGLEVQWYKYPLRGFEANMDITDDQFLDVLRDCTNSMEDGKEVRVLHDIRRWWADRKTEPSSSENPNNSTISKMEQVDEPMKTTDYCDICKRDMCENCVADATNPYCVPSHYEINYEPKDEPTISKMEQVDKDINVRSKDEPQTDCLTCRYNSDEWDSPKCDGCSKAYSNYEPQTDCAWK